LENNEKIITEKWEYKNLLWFKNVGSLQTYEIFEFFLPINVDKICFGWLKSLKIKYKNLHKLALQ